MLNQKVVENLNALLKGSSGLVPPQHLLLYDCLAEPDEDVVVFIDSFILVGPEQDNRRAVIKQLDLESSDFACLEDSCIGVSVHKWLSCPDQQDTSQSRYVEKQDNYWRPNWQTENVYMLEGAQYIPIFA